MCLRMSREALSLAIVLCEELRVAEDNLGNLPQGRLSWDGLAAKGSAELRKEPRAAEAAAPDLHAVATGLFHHAARILGAEDIAVAQNRDSSVC